METGHLVHVKRVAERRGEEFQNGTLVAPFGKTQGKQALIGTAERCRAADGG